MHSVSRQNRRSAFTLVEIMLVVVIIGTLAAILVPRLAGKSQKAKVTAAQVEIASLSSALDQFEQNVGRYPTSDEGLLALWEKPASLGPEVEWDGPYLKQLKPDPWGHEYLYQVPPVFGVDYDLISYGPDGQEGGDDDISNVSKDAITRRGN